VYREEASNTPVSVNGDGAGADREEIMEQKQYHRSEAAGDRMVQLVCFKLADEEYALEITRVQEVIKFQAVTPVPQMPSFVLGVVNIRGNVIPVFDLRDKFGLPSREFDQNTKILVVDFGGVMVSVVVDEILDNIKVPNSCIDETPGVKLKIDRECVAGLALIDDRMVIILDADEVSRSLNQAIGMQG